MSLTAADIMEPDVETVTESEEVGDVLTKLARKHYSGFPVVDDETGRLVGIVTRTDLVDIFQPSDRTLWIPIGLPPFLESMEYGFDLSWGGLDAELDLARNAGKPISAVMTEDVVTVREDATLDELLDVLAGDDPDINRVPVVDSGGFVQGLVTRQDVLRALRDERRA
ncbi:CBS domain-containing protein [Halocalculus aciditolerans]|uniref:CBS domain-containing protein n=1 Tax=Halocalculus aciditolerans TaxID=1383812 RepID=A0A830FJ02_9EURY|nr:CBS domain-containing protein [Halocalculus aciditolerans]GGL51711.1 CBS domain-containing protein [Halocalculus aciditolerans]